MIKALFPGNFDPPTYGHLNIIERASKMFDELSIIISINSSKKPFFTTEERLDLMNIFCKNYYNVNVIIWSGLVVDYAHLNNIGIIVRGLRPLSDFAYEFEMATINRQINKNIETLFIPTLTKYSVLRSSALKEMALFGADITNFAPPEVISLVENKIKNIKSFL